MKTFNKISRVKSSRARKVKHPRYSPKWLDAVELVATDISCYMTDVTFLSGSGSMSHWRVDAIKIVTINNPPQHIPYSWNPAYENDVKPTVWAATAPIWSNVSPMSCEIDVNSGDMGASDSNAKWRLSHSDSKQTCLFPTDALLASLPVYTNVSGVWEFDHTGTKVSPSGAAHAVVNLTSAHGAEVQVGIFNLPSHGLSVVCLHATTKGTRLSTPLPLPKADSYCFEIAVDPKTGQTTFWVNDEGLDMGVLDGFQGGAHAAGFVAGALSPSDHLLSGRFINCAFAKDGIWQKVEFSTDNSRHKLALHQESKILAPDSISFRDLRTAVA